MNQEAIRRLRQKALEIVALCDELLSSSSSPEPGTAPSDDEGEKVALIRERIEAIFGDQFDAPQGVIRAIARAAKSTQELEEAIGKMARRAEKGWRPQNPYPYLLAMFRRPEKAEKSSDLLRSIADAVETALQGEETR